MRILGMFLICFAIVMGFMAVIVLFFTLTGDGVNQQVDLCFLFTGGVLLFVAAVSLIIGIVVFRRSKPILGKSTTVPTGTAVGEYTASIPIKRELDGVDYTILYTPPVKGKKVSRPSVLRISTYVDVDGEFEIVPESGFDRFAKHWGLAREIQTFDEKFDHHCFVRSDTVEFTEAYLGNPDNRGIIANLHEMGFKSVAMKQRELKAEWIGFDPLKDDSPDLTEEVGARLILLARKLPPDLPEPDLSAAKRRQQWQLCLWIALIAFAITILSLLAFPPVRTSELLARAAPIFLIGYPLLMLVATLVLRGTSRSHYAWRSLAVGGLILFPVGSMGIIASLNGLMDDSQPVVHEALITRKYTTRSENSTNYHVECQSWRNPGETESFQISSGEYSRVFEGRSQLIVTTRSGWLGMEWIKGKHVSHPKQKRGPRNN